MERRAAGRSPTRYRTGSRGGAGRSIVYELVERGWVQARIEGIPEVITAGPTKAEARELVLDALREYLLSIRGNGDAVDREQVDLFTAGR